MLQFSNFITGLGRNKGENIRTDVPTAKGVKAPICLDRGDLRIMIIEIVVLGSNELLWDSISKQNGKRPVLIDVGFVLVKG